MSRSAALCGGASRFVPAEVDIEGEGFEPTVLKTFCLSGFGPAFKGFVLSFRPTEGVAVVVAATGLAENDKTSLSAPSSRFRPSSIGGGDSEEPEPDESCSSSACARSICSAINRRSRCSSDIVERSFLSAASYKGEGSQRTAPIIASGFQCLPASPMSLGCYRSKP